MICRQYKNTLILIIGTLASFLFIFVTIAFWFQHPLKNKSTVLWVEKGSSLNQITSALSSANVLDFPLLFKAVVYGTVNWYSLKAGEYLIPASVTPAQLIQILQSGNVILHPITLIEGQTTHNFIQNLLQDGRFQGQCEIPQEGCLLPETYLFQRGTSRAKIKARLEEAMSKALKEVWTNRAPKHPLNSPQELVVLASIVEKETHIAAERPIVAAVFLNRLKLGMPLQADPTVLYGLTMGQIDLNRELSLSDLKFDTPYNTYLISGLPPSPIANPGLAALRAVASPADVPYLYFVADGSGGHVFATTLEEHKKNHAKWRMVREKNNNIQKMK